MGGGTDMCMVYYVTLDEASRWARNAEGGRETEQKISVEAITN